MAQKRSSTAVALPLTDGAPPDISIIIVSYNTKELTARAVSSLLQTRGDLNLQIIVVDNSSTDGTSRHLKDEFPFVEVIDRPNEGFAAGNNRGFEASKGRYILLLNPDTEVTEGSLSSCVKHMDLHFDVGILGCSVRYPDGSLDETIFRYPKLSHIFTNIFVPRRILDRTSLFGNPRYANLPRTQCHDVEVVAGCFMLVRREVIQAVGGLDERFFMYSEETEWCWRIANNGWRIRYFPGAQIVHHGGGSTRSKAEWVSKEVAKSQLLFLRIASGDLIARTAALLMLLRDLARWGPVSLLSVAAGQCLEQRRLLRQRVRFLLSALLTLPVGQNTERMKLLNNVDEL